MRGSASDTLDDRMLPQTLTVQRHAGCHLTRQCLLSIAVVLSICCAVTFANGDAEYAMVSREAVFFKVVRPASLGYVFKALPARNFGKPFGNYPRPAFVIGAQPSNLCEADDIENASELDGNIVLVERGGCSFVSKSLAAQQHGARAVLIYDSEVDNFSAFVDMVDDKSGNAGDVSIPVAFILGLDGFHLVQALNSDHRNQLDIVIPLNVTATPDVLDQQPPWSLY